jgi:hypothetical protein
MRSDAPGRSTENRTGRLADSREPYQFEMIEDSVILPGFERSTT